MGTKTIALSFDDGTPNDERLVPLLNKYGIKATFHLNAGLIPMDDEVSEWNRLPLTRLAHLYDGHEVAAHSYSHPDLRDLIEEEILEELTMDFKILDVCFKQKTLGFAYPFGTFDERVLQQLHLTPALYARTIRDTHHFKQPTDLYLLDPTCHMSYPDLFKLTRKFIDEKSEEPLFFLIWGHSYELVTQEDWDRFESFLKLISLQKEIVSGSILECLRLMNLC